jgi:hypothetical protein
MKNVHHINVISETTTFEKNPFNMIYNKKENNKNTNKNQIFK